MSLAALFSLNVLSSFSIPAHLIPVLRPSLRISYSGCVQVAARSGQEIFETQIIVSIERDLREGGECLGAAARSP